MPPSSSPAITVAGAAATLESASSFGSTIRLGVERTVGSSGMSLESSGLIISASSTFSSHSPVGSDSESSECLMNSFAAFSGIPILLCPLAAAYMAFLWASDSNGIKLPYSIFDDCTASSPFFVNISFGSCRRL